MRTRLVHGMLAGSALVAVTGSVALAASQAGQPDESPPAAAPRSQDEAASQFLSRKRSEQGKREEVIGRRGRGAEAGQLRALYRAAGIRGPAARAGLSVENAAALNQSLETDALQLLQSLGFKPGQVRQLASAGTNPVVAAANLVRGTSTLQDQAVLADLVAVVRVVSAGDADLGDGYGSSVRLQVVEALSGTAPSQEITLRQQSSSDLYVSSDLRPEPGQTYLLVLSSELYEQVALEAGRSQRDVRDTYVLLGFAFGVEGDRLTPTPVGGEPTMTLSQVRSSLQGLKQAKSAASSAN